MRKLVYWLIRKHLGVKIGEPFRFTNQKTKDIYRFTKTMLWKSCPETVSYLDTDAMRACKWITIPAGVSLNWLLDPECEVVTMSADECINEMAKGVN